MARPETLEVELVYALPERQVLISLQLAAGTRVGEVLMHADLPNDLRALELMSMPVGIFGQKVSLDQIVRDGDRIEIYRVLHADPKLARRARVERQRRDGSKER